MHVHEMKLVENERITVKEIARLAGVSIGTVDRVLHDRGGVSEETRAKVDEIVVELGYKPNLIARQLSLNKSYVFRAMLPRSEQDSGYWSLCLEGIKRAERDLAAYGTRLIIDEFDRYDRRAYRALLESIVSDPPNGLVIAPVLPEELSPALERLAAARSGEPLPYAFFDGDLDGASPVAAVCQDAFRGGYLAGRMMSLLAPGAGALVALSAHAGDRHIRQRIEGFRSFFEIEGEGRRIETAECLGLDEPAERDRFLSSLFSGSKVAGVLVANSSGHVVGDWLAGRGSKEGCAVVSWDLVPANARALSEGRLDCVVSQRPAEQARDALQALFDAVVLGKRDEDRSPIPLEVYFKENIPPSGRGPRRREAAKAPISRCARAP